MGLEVSKEFSQDSIKIWLLLLRLQVSVNEKAGNDLLQLTAEVRKPDQAILSKVGVNLDLHLLFLDTELFWVTDEQLTFRIHVKTNQQFKY